MGYNRAPEKNPICEYSGARTSNLPFSLSLCVWKLYLKIHSKECKYPLIICLFSLRQNHQRKQCNTFIFEAAVEQIVRTHSQMWLKCPLGVNWLLPFTLSNRVSWRWMGLLCVCLLQWCWMHGQSVCQSDGKIPGIFSWRVCSTREHKLSGHPAKSETRSHNVLGVPG